MKKDYMYKYPSNVVYYSNYPYMDRNSNYMKDLRVDLLDHLF